jgi:hypothetical protein
MDLNARFTQPMRDELVTIGFAELKTPADVDAALAAKSGTSLVFVNSVCGCAAGMARPGAYFAETPPSSPSIALLKDGALVAFVPRHQIEGKSSEMVAAQIAEAIETHCETTV